MRTQGRPEALVDALMAVDGRRHGCIVGILRPPADPAVIAQGQIERGAGLPLQCYQPAEPGVAHQIEQRRGGDEIDRLHRQLLQIRGQIETAIAPGQRLRPQTSPRRLRSAPDRARPASSPAHRPAPMPTSAGWRRCRRRDRPRAAALAAGARRPGGRAAPRCAPPRRTGSRRSSQSVAKPRSCRAPVSARSTCIAVSAQLGQLARAPPARHVEARPRGRHRSGTGAARSRSASGSWTGRAALPSPAPSRPPHHRQRRRSAGRVPGPRPAPCRSPRRTRPRRTDRHSS